ncbi:MAG: hypothetical protein ACRELB_12880, partial [Polyangiaceae bacterium]
VHAGTFEDAARFAATANRTNSAVRVTNADKAATAKNLWGILKEVSAKVVAELAGIDDKTAAKYKPEELKGKPAKGKDGKVRKERSKPNGGTTNKKPSSGSAAKPTADTNGVNRQPEGTQSTSTVGKAAEPVATNGTKGAAPPAPTPTPEPEPSQPPAAVEPEETGARLTHTLRGSNGTATLAILPKKTGNQYIVLAASDRTADSAIVALIERAKAVGRDLTTRKGTDALYLMGLGVEELERRRDGERQSFREMEEMAEREQSSGPTIPGNIVA